MPINAHFIQAAKLLAPGASYHADLVLPHIRDLADICQRVVISISGEVLVSCEGQDVRGDTLKFLTLARISTPAPPWPERSVPPSAIDSAAITSLLLDEVVAEFGLERTAASARAYPEQAELPVSVGWLLTDLLAQARGVDVSLRTPGARLRLRHDGSMAIGLRVSR